MRLTQPSAITLVALATVACRHTRDEVEADSTGPTSLESSGGADGTTGVGSSSTGSADVTGTFESSGTTGGMPLCETVLCGDPAVCCDDDEECVLGACLAVCDSQVRCGEDLTTCCGSGDVCLQPDCITPGQACLDSYDCPEGQFCEPSVGGCLPSQDPVACELTPTFDTVELTLEWSFETEQFVTTPLVGDVDGDQLPDVIVNSFWAGSHEYDGEIIILNGQTGAEKVRVVQDANNNSYGSYSRTTPVLADVDGNGLADIVYAGRPQSGTFFNMSTIHAVNGLGIHLWGSHDADMADHPLYTRNGALLATNLDDDEESEIVIGIGILDHNGLVVADDVDWNGNAARGAGAFGSPDDGYIGSVATAADLNGDNYPEIISGRDAWSISWMQPMIGNPDATATLLWTAPGGDGYPAIGDLDQNGTPEVIIVASGVVTVVDGATGQLWCGRDATGAACAGNDTARTQPFALIGDGMGGAVGRGGPATVADFDGDGRPEIGIAGGSAYMVLDFAREGEDIVQPAMGFLPPGPGDIYVRWFSATQDQSSNATGSSVFDFQGDGAAEVMYQDECFARVFDGATGEVLVELENSTPTIHEYPIVADVDNDGNSEFMVVASDDNPALCMGIPDYTSRRGIYVYGDANDRWVRTRQVWTQHTYHVTNADSSALTPVTEDPNWLQPGLNNFRQNVQGEGVFNAPDLSVDLSVGTQSCQAETFHIYVTVRNEGSIGVPPGVVATLYEGTDATGTLVGTNMTAQALLPGGFVQFEFLVPAPAQEPKNYFATVDNAESGTGAVLECDEDNNTGSTATVACPIPG